MARPKNAEASERIRLDGYQRMPITDPREKVFWDWYVKHRANRKAFSVAKELLLAALNGELGQRVAEAVYDGNTEEAIDALQDLMGAFGGESEPSAIHIADAGNGGMKPPSLAPVAEGDIPPNIRQSSAECLGGDGS